ncbi:hypothetical protein PMKS-000914 [Pichia membranifaciens]|uniref:Exonuclease domain-containing protein n=1 Tax=Pichia membranifaciens TaxID=4926 RepID=A0A1Q2YCZ6_9ASCO|nr:hypothetical protein PMKS-000914 [Pichia membranifaciens]
MSSNWLKLLQKQKQQQEKYTKSKDVVSSHHHTKGLAIAGSRKSQKKKTSKSVVPMRTPLTKIAKDQAEAKVQAAHKAQTLRKAQAQRDVAKLLKDKVLVGHAIHHDLEALYLTHPKHSIRDTAKHTPFKTKYSKGKTPGLKKLAQEILGLDIQSGEHSSVEDARATMLIYKSDRKNFEEKVRATYHHK